jgi:RsmE family RNA methyltransferase
VEQSNAAFLPDVVFCEWKEVPWKSYEKVLLLDSQSKKNDLKQNDAISAKQALIVGPEAGFSSAELTFLSSLDMINKVHLPTPILRTPTAVAAGAGIMIQSLLK